MEVACLPEVFVGVNTIFTSTAIKGMLVRAGDSIDLAALQASAADRRADVPPGGVMSEKLPALSRKSGGVPLATSQRLLPFKRNCTR
jgi:hypothetical protein